MAAGAVLLKLGCRTRAEAVRDKLGCRARAEAVRKLAESVALSG
jgi:DNA-binding CsgD family transcriptional regulator